MWKNPPLMLVLFIYTINVITTSVLQLLYYVNYATDRSKAVVLV